LIKLFLSAPLAAKRLRREREWARELERVRDPGVSAVRLRVGIGFWRRVCKSNVVVVLVFALAGCKTYSPVDAEFADKSAGVRIDLPAGWLHYKPGKPGYVMTRDGLRLVRIEIVVAKYGDELPGTQRVYRAEMPPHEMAELSTSLLGAADIRKNFAIEKIELAQIAGRAGFRAAASFVDPHGLPMRLLVCGVGLSRHYLELRYDAAGEVYFDRRLDEFEQVVQSARAP